LEQAAQGSDGKKCVDMALQGHGLVVMVVMG